MELRNAGKSRADIFVAANSNKFSPNVLGEVRDTLASMSADHFAVTVSEANFRDPSLILLVAVFLGWDRFFLDDAVLGIVKVLTLGGLGVWWFIDLFTAAGRTKRYNYRRFLKITS